MQWQPSNNALEDFLRQQQEYDLYELKRDGSIDDGREGISTDPGKYPMAQPAPQAGPYGYAPSGRGMIRVPLRQAATPGAQLQRALVGNNTDFEGYISAPEEAPDISIPGQMKEYSGTRTYDRQSSADWVQQQRLAARNEAGRKAGMSPDEMNAQDRSISPPTYQNMSQIPQGESGYLRDPANQMLRLYTNDTPTHRDGNDAWHSYVANGNSPTNGVYTVPRPGQDASFDANVQVPSNANIRFATDSDGNQKRWLQQQADYKQTMANMRAGQDARAKANPPKMDISRIRAMAGAFQRQGIPADQALALGTGFESQLSGQAVAPNSLLMAGLVGTGPMEQQLRGQAMADAAKMQMAPAMLEAQMRAEDAKFERDRPRQGTPAAMQEQQDTRNTQLEFEINDPTVQLTPEQMKYDIERGAKTGTYSPKVTDELMRFYDSDEYDNHEGYGPQNWLGKGGYTPEVDAEIFANGAFQKYKGGSIEAYKQFYRKHIQPKAF